MKNLCSIIAVVLCFSLSLSIGMFTAPATVYASPHEDDDCHDHHDHGKYTKFYGTVEKMPENLTGVWIIGGKAVTVTENTRIRQKHGKISVGTFVEVKGAGQGTAIVAHEIEFERNRP